MLKFFLAGKIQGGTPLQFLSQKSSGEMLCKFFDDTFVINLIKFQ